MWNARENGETRQQGEGVVAVAVDKEKSSQYALKWAVENLFPRHNPLKLVHVVQRSASPPPNPGVPGNSDIITHQEPAPALEVLLPYRIFCIRRQVQFETVILHDPDVARALIDYVSQGGVDTLLLGTSSRNSISRIFKNSDIPSSVLKRASDFCNVYIISKGKVSAMRPASRSAQANLNHHANPDVLYDELSVVENDDSLVSSERQSTDSNCSSFYEYLGSGLTIGSSSDILNLDDGSFEPSCRARPSLSFLNQDYIEDEIRRHKVELNKAMDLYHAACREAKVTKQKLIELQDWNMKQEQRMKEIELENARCKAAIEAAQRLTEQEVEKRVLKAEIKAMIEADEKQKVLDALRQFHTVIKYQSLFHLFVVLFLSYLFSKSSYSIFLLILLIIK